MHRVNRTEWTPEALREASAALERRTAQERLAWALDEFGNDLAIAVGFGTSGIVVLHMARQLRSDLSPYFLDTDLLFPETYALRERLEEKLDLKIERVHSGLSLEAQEAQHGPDLWARNPDLCCNLRKVEPMREHLAGKRAWVTAIRRDQTANRASAGVVEWDLGNDLVRVSPLVDWTSKDVWRYIFQHDLPYNPLHDQNYPSVGCMPCTRAVKPGEDERSGRWAGTSKTECGIHLPEDLAKVA